MLHTFIEEWFYGLCMCVFSRMIFFHRSFSHSIHRCYQHRMLSFPIETGKTFQCLFNVISLIFGMLLLLLLVLSFTKCALSCCCFFLLSKLYWIIKLTKNLMFKSLQLYQQMKQEHTACWTLWTSELIFWLFPVPSGTQLA